MALFHNGSRDSDSSGGERSPGQAESEWCGGEVHSIWRRTDSGDRRGSNLGTPFFSLFQSGGDEGGTNAMQEHVA
jgi:hypothetical protein